MPPVLSQGDTGEWVKYLQEILHGAQWLAEEPSGTFDQPTVTALIGVQGAMNLHPTGVADADTWRALGVADDHAAAAAAEHGGHAGADAASGQAAAGGADHDYGTGVGHRTWAEHAHDVMEGTEFLTHLGEAGALWAGLATEGAEAVLEVVEPLNWVLSIGGGILYAIDAFGAGEFVDHAMGQVYGVMYEAHNMTGPGEPPPSNDGHSDQATFVNGVTAGHGILQDNPHAASLVRLAIARHDSLPVLQTLWQAACHSSHGIERDFQLGWPGPEIVGL